MKKNTLSYDILNQLYDSGFMTQHNLRHLMCLQNQEVFDVDSAEKARIANASEQLYPNYVRIESDDDSSLVQLWGKPKRGIVIVEFRKRLFDMVECDKVKLFRESKHEIYKGQEQHRLIVVDNVEQGVKIIQTFVERVEHKKSNKSDTTTTEKVEQMKKAK